MRLDHRGFKGELPILDPRLLPERNAQTARNLDLDRGTLRPERDTETVSDIDYVSDPETLYRYRDGEDDYWLTWAGRVHVVASPLADDSHKRIYWTGDGEPKMAPLDHATSGDPPYPSNHYRLGVPAPLQAPDVSAPWDRPGWEDHPDTALVTTYVVTFVTEYGEEGPPSEASEAIDRWDMVEDAPDGGEVEVDLPDIPSGPHNIVTKRLYRVESGGIYQRVADLDASDDSYTDEVESDDLGVALPSEDWDMPPDDLEGLIDVPGGFLAGFFDNTLCFSEAYYPHAWPVGYRLAFKERIVAIASTAAGVVVATEGRPYLVSGSTPQAMQSAELDVRQACLSAESLVDMGGYGLYASHDGLVAIGGREGEVVTREAMSRQQWLDLDPSTIHAYRYNGRYLAFYADGAFAFTPEEGFEFYDVSADGGYYDVIDDRLYLIQGNDIAAWGEGSELTFTWRSRIHEVPPGGSGFSCAKVVAAGYPVTFRLIADGEEVVSHEVEDPQMFRLPPGHVLSREWEVEIEGDFEVMSVQVAQTPSELV